MKQHAISNRITPWIRSTAAVLLPVATVSPEGLGQETDPAPKKKGEVFVKNPPKAPDDDDADSLHYDIGMLFEFIRLDHRTANRLMRQFASRAADARELRDTLEKLITEDQAELMETAWVWGSHGQRSRAESIREVIHATEYDPPELPGTYNVAPPIHPEPIAGPPGEKTPANPRPLPARERTQPADLPITSATPTAFETRHVGTTVEVDPVLSEDRKEISLNLSPEIITQLEDRYYIREGREETATGIDHVSMPTYYTMRTTTQLTAVPGNYNLLSIHTPPDDKNQRVIVLLKADLIPIE